MATSLTTEQIADTRLIIMDTDSGDTVLSDAQIESLWQKSYDNLYVLYILCLQRVWGEYAQKVALTDTFGDSRQLNSLATEAKRILDYYTSELAKTGYAIIGGVLIPIEVDSAVRGSGSIDLFIDVEDDEDETGIVYW